MVGGHPLPPPPPPPEFFRLSMAFVVFTFWSIVPSLVVCALVIFFFFLRLEESPHGSCPAMPPFGLCCSLIAGLRGPAFLFFQLPLYDPCWAPPSVLPDLLSGLAPHYLFCFLMKAFFPSGGECPPHRPYFLPVDTNRPPLTPWFPGPPYPFVHFLTQPQAPHCVPAQHPSSRAFPPPFPPFPTFLFSVTSLGRDTPPRPLSHLFLKETFFR